MMNLIRTQPILTALSAFLLCGHAFAADPSPEALVKQGNAAFDKGDIITAHDIANALVEDPRLEQKRRECKLRLQNSDSTWEQPTDYFPVFVRASARPDTSERDWVTAFTASAIWASVPPR